MLTLVAENKRKTTKGNSSDISTRKIRDENVLAFAKQVNKGNKARQQAIEAVKKRAELLHW
ncbi:hypothetical protein [uncultured Pseudoalteromonas sp.]|uniref:hypothetical protein n=1 Tax=uncultured Pseudoalteromonas sp. TaxID=114053 RepID=UPI0030DA05F5|tara:strand:- start:290 stop:472 length:183 start_codon:yes stop_codon:yes gene_type:complete